MTKEVMKQALDALNTPRPSDSYPPLWRTYENTINNAIKALEEALKQEQDEADDLTIAYMAGLYDGKKQAKQEQGEPVAGYYFPLTNEIMRGSIEALIAHAKRARWTDAIVRKDGVETKYEADWIKKLVPYTTPQTKEWVELTKQEYDDIYASNKDSIYEAMMVVATYLKRKNK